MKNQLSLYSKPGCSKCFLLERWLMMKGVDYNKVDIQANEEALELLVSQGRTSLPQVANGDGFIDYQEFNELLAYV